MTAFSGREIAIGFGFQKDANTVATPVVWFPTTDRDFSRKVNKITNESSVGDRFKIFSHSVVRNYGDGGWGGIVDAHYFPYLISSVLGSLPTSKSDGSGQALVGTHINVMNPSSNVLNASIYCKTPPYNEVFNQSRAGKLTITANADEFVTYAIEFMGVTGTDSAQTASYVKAGVMASGAIEDKVGAINTDGTKGTDLNVKNFTLEIDTMLEGYGSIGSTDYQVFVPKAVGVTGTLSILFENNTEREHWYNNNNRTLYLKMTSGDVIGSTSTPYSIAIEMKNVSYTEVTENRGTDDIQLLNMNYEAESQGENSADSIKVTTVNGTAEYTLPA